MTSSSPEQLEFDVHPDGSILVAGELDLASAPLLRTVLTNQIAAGLEEIVLDLSQLAFCDSSGLSVLVWAHQELAAAGGKLVLRAPSNPVQRLLSTTHLEGELNIQ